MTDVQAPISQAYQLLVGRIVAIEDKEELIEKYIDNHRAISRTIEERMDDLWDAVMAFFDRVEQRLPDESKRVAYTAPAEPVCPDCYQTNGDHTPYCGTPIG